MKSVIRLAILLCTIGWRTRLIDAASAKCPDQSESAFTVNIPHETECSKFYICQKGKKIEVVCPSILEFNTKSQTCDWPEKANCPLKSKGVHPPNPSYDNLESPINDTTDTGSDCTEDQQTPHETRCNRYYRCVYGKKVLKTCRHNMVFNAELGMCDFKYNVQCGALILPDRVKRGALYDGDFLEDYIETPNKQNAEADQDADYWNDFLNQRLEDSSDESVSVGVDYLSTEKVQNLPGECPEDTNPYEPALLPHETKCNAYYKCFNGNKQLLLCPGILQFDPKVLLCDWPSNVRCIERKLNVSSVAADSNKQLHADVCPRTKCQDTTTYLPSMTNPRQFVRCDNGREIQGDCPNGLVFDVKLKVCNLAHLADTVSKQS